MSVDERTDDIHDVTNNQGIPGIFSNLPSAHIIVFDIYTYGKTKYIFITIYIIVIVISKQLSQSLVDKSIYSYTRNLKIICICA